MAIQNGSLIGKIKLAAVSVLLAGLSACGSSDEKKDEASAPPPSGKDGIRKVIAGHAAEIQKCYTAELRNTPALEGKVTMAWIIDKTGGVSKSWIKSSTTKNKNLEDCMIENVNNWKFAPPPEGKEEINVSYPFVFKVQKD